MDHIAFEALGAGILAHGISHSSLLLNLLDGLLDGLPLRGASGDYALYATPSYALRLSELAKERGLDLSSLDGRKDLFPASRDSSFQATGLRKPGLP